jgi:copper chaperone CopZ
MNETMETTTFTAPDIVCDGCANSIKNVLGKVPGVSAVDVTVETKAVTVSHDDTVTRDALAARLDKAGFPVS